MGWDSNLSPTVSGHLLQRSLAQRGRSRTKVPTLLQRRGGEANAKVALQEAGCGQWGLIGPRWA